MRCPKPTQKAETPEDASRAVGAGPAPALTCRLCFLAELILTYINKADEMLDIVLSPTSIASDVSQADNRLIYFCETLERLVEARGVACVISRIIPHR